MPSKEYIASGNGSTLMDLPLDIFGLIVQKLGVGHQADRGSARDMACVARTCKKLRRDIAPYLYEKVYSRIGTTHDTSGIVRLVCQNPEIRPMIRTMVLDDFDHRETRRLLSHEFPRLRRLLVQHGDGTVPRSISAREKRYLNKSIRPQPMLNHLVFMILLPDEPDELARRANVPCPAEPYELTEDDVALWNHPRLRYIRLAGLNFGAFEKSGAPAIQHKELSTLFLDDTKYTSKAFQQLIMPSSSLTKITLCESYRLALTYDIYSTLLAHSAATLTDLKLCWMGPLREPEGKEAVFDFNNFKALRTLAINPAYVLGRRLPTGGDQEIRDDAQLIVRRLAPNIRRLILGKLVSPYPSPSQTAFTPMLRAVLSHEAEILIQVLCEQKKALLPKLAYLYVDCGHSDTFIPHWLFDIGDKFEVGLGVVGVFELCDEEVSAMSLLD